MEEIPNNHLGCIKPFKKWDKLPTSTGDRRISSINSSTVSILTFEDLSFSEFERSFFFHGNGELRGGPKKPVEL